MRSLTLLAALAPLAAVAFSCSSSDPAAPPADAAAESAPPQDGARPDTGDDASRGDAAVDAPADAPADSPADAPTEGGAVCITGGTAAAGVTGTGTCADPYVINVSASALGTIVFHTASGGGDIAGLSGPAPCAAMFSATARDIIYRIDMPNTVTSLDVTVDGVGTADPRIGVHEDPSCGQPINACANAGGAGACEAVRAPRNGSGFFGASTFVNISEATNSAQTLTVRFRAN